MGTVIELPYDTDWGWETSQTAGYIPKLTTLAIAEVAFFALISCKCAKSYMGNCNCLKADLECARVANVEGPVISRRLEL